jgi:hypothetical protein
MVGSNSAVTLWPIVCFGFTCEGDEGDGYVAVAIGAARYLSPVRGLSVADGYSVSSL